MRSFLIFAVALIFSVSASAQDLLVKLNGEQMKVKVLKITKKKVQFVRYGSDHPVYTLPVSDIDYIEYPMGDRDTFNKSTAAKVNTPQAPVANAAENNIPKRWHGSVPAPTAMPQYCVGDIYDENGVRGVVAVLYGDNHGLVMSLDEACLAWSTLPRKMVKKTGAKDRYNGMANMQAIEKYIADNNLSWNDFPAFKWCREKGNGWYLPSINELWSIGTMSMGGSRAAISRKFRKHYNKSIEEAEGTPVSNLMFYHSSTEDDDFKYSLYSHMNSELPTIDTGFKADKLFVRAVYKF